MSLTNAPVALRRTLAALTCLSAVACSDLTRPATADTRTTTPSAARRTLDPGHFVQALPPQTIVRGTGVPATASFTIAGYGPGALLHVVNGDQNGDDRVTSAEITLDGRSLLDPSTFKKNFASFDTSLAIGNPSVLAVRLTGAPGAKLTISMEATLATTARLADAGQAATLLGGQVSIVPSASLATPITVTAQPVTTDPTQPANIDLVGGSAVDLGPEGTTFAKPITIQLRYDPAQQPSGFTQAALRLATLEDGRWVEIHGSTVDVVHHTVSGQTTHFSTYGVVAFETFTQVSIGDNHVCGVTPNQDAYCWGLNSLGQLGAATSTVCTQPNGTTQPCSSTPLLVDGGLKWASISAAGNRTCGLTTSGDAYCWGGGALGLVGDGGQSNRAAPTLVSGGIKWTAISAGVSSACGLTATGQAYCWGANDVGELGSTTSLPMCAPLPPSRISKPCATTPIPVSASVPFTEISAGLSNDCALDANGHAWCWGWGLFGANGDGTSTNRFSPVPVAGGLTFQHVVAGGLSSCGLGTDGVGYCWGTNSPFRMLGIGVAPDHFTPIAVSGGLSFQSLLASKANDVGEHNCGLTTTGDIWCWGGNGSQQLGAGVSNETCGSGVVFACQNVPVQVAAGRTYRFVAVGGELTCATATDGETYCMGNDTDGQIGDGTVSTSSVFTRVPRP